VRQTPARLRRAPPFKRGLFIFAVSRLRVIPKAGIPLRSIPAYCSVIRGQNSEIRDQKGVIARNEVTKQSRKNLPQRTQRTQRKERKERKEKIVCACRGAIYRALFVFTRRRGEKFPSPACGRGVGERAKRKRWVSLFAQPSLLRFAPSREISSHITHSYFKRAEKDSPLPLAGEGWGRGCFKPTPAFGGHPLSKGGFSSSRLRAFA